MTESTTRSPSPLHAFNMILVTVCVTSLVAATIMLIVLMWGEDLGDTMARAFATVGIACVSSLFGIVVNSIGGRHLQHMLPLICWLASWSCIVVGSIVGGVAIWINENNDDILLKTIATIFVLFVASTIGAALAGMLGNAATRSSE